MFLLIRSQFMALAPYLERAALILLVEPFDCEVSFGFKEGDAASSWGVFNPEEDDRLCARMFPEPSTWGNEC